MAAVCDLKVGMGIGQLAGVADPGRTAFGIVCVIDRRGLPCDLRTSAVRSERLGAVFFDLPEPIQLRRAIGLRCDQDDRVPTQGGDGLFDLHRIPVLHNQAGGDGGLRLPVEPLLEERRSAARGDDAVVGLLLFAR